VHSQRRDGPCRIGGARHTTLWARPSEWAPQLEVPSGKSFEYRGAAPRRSGRGHGTLSHWRNFSRGTGGASGWRCATGWRNCAIQRGTVSRYGRMRRSRRSSIHGHGPSLAQLFSPGRRPGKTALCQALAQLCQSPKGSSTAASSLPAISSRTSYKASPQGQGGRAARYHRLQDSRQHWEGCRGVQCEGLIRERGRRDRDCRGRDIQRINPSRHRPSLKRHARGILCGRQPAPSVPTEAEGSRAPWG
jgi:hypothetical protein